MERVRQFVQMGEQERNNLVAAFQKRYRSPFFDALTPALSLLSAEEFYVPLFILLFWGPLCHSRLGWNIALIIGYGFPIGNSLKNVFSIRRPSSPPVWKMANFSSEEIEFGFPSTHAMMGAAVGTYIAHYFLTHLGHAENALLIIWWILFVFIWPTSISLSRVYLGAHTFQDIAGGWLIGMVYGQLWTVLGDYLDRNISEKNFTYFAFAVLLVWIMFVFHPVNKRSWIKFHLSEGCFDYSASLLGVALTALVVAPLYPGDHTCKGISWALLFRWVLGLALLLSIYFGTAKVLPFVFEPLLKALGVAANYLGYKEFKVYLAESIDYYGAHASTEAGTSNGHGGNGRANGNGHTHYSSDINHRNPEKRLAWVRLLTKIFQYFLFSTSIGLNLPLLFIALGI